MSKPYSLSNFFDEITSGKPIETKLDNLQNMHDKFENSKNPYSTFAFYPRFRNFEDVALSVISPVTSFFTLAVYTAFAALITTICATLSLFTLSIAGLSLLLHEDDVVEEFMGDTDIFASIAVTGLASTIYLVVATIISPLADTLSLFIRSAESIASEIEECIQTEDNSFTCH